MDVVCRSHSLFQLRKRSVVRSTDCDLNRKDLQPVLVCVRLHMQRNVRCKMMREREMRVAEKRYPGHSFNIYSTFFFWCSHHVLTHLHSHTHIRRNVLLNIRGEYAITHMEYTQVHSSSTDGTGSNSNSSSNMSKHTKATAAADADADSGQAVQHRQSYAYACSLYRKP